MGKDRLDLQSQSHKRCHKNFIRINVCPICQKRITDVGRMRFHLHKKHGKSDEIGNFKCDLCGKMNYSEQSHIAHYEKEHLGKRKYVCITCDITFKSAVLLKRHDITLHQLPKKSPEKNSASLEEIPIWKCNKCSFVCKDLCDYIDHQCENVTKTIKKGKMECYYCNQKIGESYESFVRKRALVKFQSQSEVL